MISRAELDAFFEELERERLRAEFEAIFEEDEGSVDEPIRRTGTPEGPPPRRRQRIAVDDE